ncbi:MAG TPA: protein kinase, partial [Rugosimonospora sp.]|nr:protein kinase [Rugosimonospora sp.]
MGATGMFREQTALAGRYRLLRELGVGGMGRVWLARDETLGRDVAIKEVVPPPDLSNREQVELRLRTLREARTAARLDHPNLVRIYDVVQTDDQPWIVMEYVASRSLQDVITEDGPLEPAHAARIGLPILAALRAAHAGGVLHRDVKPANVLLAHDGRAVLTDFGLATLQGGESALTTPGLVIGSVRYLPPERAHDGTATPESDLWSLGATLYAAVEGRPPYARNTVVAILTALATSPPDPPQHAGALKPVLGALLRRNPRDRPKPEAVRRALQKVAGDGRRRRGFGRRHGPTPIPVSPAPAGYPIAAPAPHTKTLTDCVPSDPATVDTPSGGYVEGVRPSTLVTVPLASLDGEPPTRPLEPARGDSDAYGMPFGPGDGCAMEVGPPAPVIVPLESGTDLPSPAAPAPANQQSWPVRLPLHLGRIRRSRASRRVGRRM